MKRYCYRCCTNQDFTVAPEGRSEAWESSHVEAWGSSHVVARGSSHVVAWGSSHVEARESSHVEAWGSSHVVARGSSHVEARESSHVEARESSHVVAWESSHVVAWESSHVVAFNLMAVLIVRSALVSAAGGIIVEAWQQTTKVDEWADRCRVKRLQNGALVLYKRTDANFATRNEIVYAPGTEVVAPDWDGGKAECGGGLHMCPTAKQCDGFRDYEGDRYVACAVQPEDVVLHAEPDYPDKVKVRACLVLYECDREGVEIQQVVTA